MLNDEEKRLLKNILEDEVVSLAKEMIKINSENPPGNEKNLAEYMKNIFKEMGLQVTQIDFPSGRPNIVAVYNMGFRNKSIIFDGHLDTVPCGDLSLWSVDPLGGIVKDDRLYGGGSADMKGSIAAFTYALKRLIDLNIELEGNIIVILTSNEEITGLGTKKVLEKGFYADAAIVGEPSCLEVNIAHKGVARWRLITYGKSTHASTPEYGINAIYKMAKAINRLEQLAERYSHYEKKHPILGYPTLNVGVIKGGTKDNIVPDFCEITIDRRLLPGEKSYEVEEEIKAEMTKIQFEDPHFKYDLKMYHSHEAAETSSKHPFVQLAKNTVYDILGKESTVEGFVATTEMSHLVEAGIPSIILGCGDIKVAHTINEYVPLQQLVDATKIYTIILTRYLRKNKVI